MFATGDAHILWSRLIGALRLTFSSSHSKLSKVLLQWQLLELFPRKVRLFLKKLILTQKFSGKGKHKNPRKGRKFGERSTPALEWSHNYRAMWRKTLRLPYSSKQSWQKTYSPCTAPKGNWPRLGQSWNRYKG